MNIEYTEKLHSYMGLFSNQNSHLEKVAEELEKYEAKTGRETTVIIEEGQKNDDSIIYCDDCGHGKFFDLSDTTDGCSCRQ